MTAKLFAALAVTILSLPPTLWAQEASTSTATTLDTVVVTATRTEEKVREVTANTTVITNDQIRGSTANSMDQLLAQQGFQIINQGTQKLLRIRGMGQNSMSTEMSSNVLVLLNGRRIGINNVALMGLANVDRIEIIRGPSAVQYGSSAMGGVVNIITKRGEEGFKSSVEAGFGSFGLDKEELAMSGGAGNLDFSAGLTRSSRDNYEVKGGHEWKHTSYDSLTSMNLDLGFSFLEKHRLGLNFNYYDENDVQSPSGGWTQTGGSGANQYYNQYDLKNTNLAFTYEGGTPDDLFNWMFRFAKGKDETKGVSMSAWGDSPEDTTLDNRSITAQVGYDGEMLSVSTGFDFLRYDIDGTHEGKGVQKDTAGFVSSKLRLFDEKFILSAGGRYDSFSQTLDQQPGEKTETNFAPSVGAAYLPVDWLKFRTNWSKGFRMPTPKELYGGGAYYVSNMNLGPEKSKTWELGADVSWEYINSSLTYFSSDWADKIVANSVPGYKYQFQNLKSVRLAGLEFSFDVNIGQALDQPFDLTPYVNLTYMTTRKNKDPDQVRTVGQDTVPNTPDLMASYGLRFNHPDYGFMANVNASYYGSSLTYDRRYGSPTNGQYIDTDGGTVVDLSLEKKLFEFCDHNSVSARVEVNNIFDDKNESYLDYRGPGRNFYVGLRYDYN